MHDLGPEIRRAISGNLGEEEFPDKDVEEPMHRVTMFYHPHNVVLVFGVKKKTQLLFLTLKFILIL